MVAHSILSRPTFCIDLSHPLFLSSLAPLDTSLPTPMGAKKVGAVGTYHLFPTFHLNTWNLIVKEKERTRIGIIEKGTIQWKDELPHRYHNHPAVQSTINHPTIRSFLYFTDHEYVRVFPRHFGYEVRWIDVRFYYRDHFALMAVAWIDAHHRILDTHIGWDLTSQIRKNIPIFLLPNKSLKISRYVIINGLKIGI